MALDEKVIRERLEETFTGESQQTVAEKLHLGQSRLVKEMIFRIFIILWKFYRSLLKWVVMKMLKSQAYFMIL